MASSNQNLTKKVENEANAAAIAIVLSLKRHVKLLYCGRNCRLLTAINNDSIPMDNEIKCDNFSTDNEIEYIIRETFYLNH